MYKVVAPTPSALFRKHHGLSRGNVIFRSSYIPKASFSLSHNPNFGHSKSHAKWTVPQSIQNWWSALKTSFGPKPLHKVNHITKKLDNSSSKLSIAVVNPTQEPKQPNPPKAKKPKKKTNTIPIYTTSKYTNKQYFEYRLQQILCYFYAGVLSGTQPASPSVKKFISKTHFNDAFILLSQAVFPETKRMISGGMGFGLSTTSYRNLKHDCWIPNQGCYMNVIKTPKKELGVYIGGSGSTANTPWSVTRPLRGRISSPPYAQRKPGVPCGVGRRIAQHLNDLNRLKKTSAHYRFMEQKGNKYDFRLLAAFENKVDIGAVWLLEAFFVLELGTMPDRKSERNGSVAPAYVGLNRASPLLTQCVARAAMQVR